MLFIKFSTLRHGVEANQNFKTAIYVKKFFLKGNSYFFLHLFKQIPFSTDLCSIHNLLHALNCLKMGF